MKNFKNSHWHELPETRKMLIFSATQEHFLEIFNENSADKIQSKKDKGMKVPSLMPCQLRLTHFLKILPSKFDLTEHCSQVHEGKKIYFCLLCEACFGCKVTLSNHMTRHHSKSVVWCPKCDLGFLCVTHLDRHILMYHEKNVDISVNMIATSSDKFKKVCSELLFLKRKKLYSN